MNSWAREKTVADVIAESPAFFDTRPWRQKIKSVEPAELIWWIFTACVSFAILPSFAGEITAPLSYVIAIGGAAGCGWLWLLTRTLFRAEKPLARWTLYSVAGIVAVEAAWEITSAGASSGAAGELRRIAANAASFICIGALVMVFVEMFHGFNDQLPKHERRFRQIFASVFGVMIAITIIWAINPPEMSLAAKWGDAITAASALLGIVGSRMAVNFRKAHPLSATQKRKPASALSPAANDQALAQRIVNAIEQDDRYTTPDLKVADVAAALGEQEYKVTQSITGALGYRNFNQLINAHRITLAKQVLADRELESRPILSIAFDCGFNSIGPFNRAFKQETGLTPRAFRMEAMNGAAMMTA